MIKTIPSIKIVDGENVNNDENINAENGKNGDKIIFRAGPHGLHGHCDQLSFVYNHNGKPFLIDPGTYIYNNRPQFRQYFRSTAAHNTLLINEREQSQQIGTFQWGRTVIYISFCF